jgi:hypothetical protein
MSLFSLGIEDENAYGNPHALALEDNQISMESENQKRAQLTDAVAAAAKILGSAKSDSSVMGREGLEPEQLAKTDAIVCATAKVALRNREDLGPARLVRLALFVDEYQRFRQAVAMKQILDELVNQKGNEYEERAYAWAKEINGATSYGSGTSRSIPWKKIFIGSGIVLGCVFGWNLYKSYKNQEPAPQPS